ncbi:MAG: hypothetical protein GTO14_19320 [Anaerolineales bacterium]|nr:hypothetical protein [Anaerolineales bacterium]
MNGYKLKWTLACILGVLLCCGHVAKAEKTSRPPNDDCYSATPIEELVNLAFDTRNATFDGPGHCMTSPNIWYRYVATCTGNVTVSLCGSNYDTMLAVYNGANCYPASGKLIECNDDFCGWQSEVTFAATAGNYYLIEVGGYESETGTGQMTISCGGEPSPDEPPANDDCWNAQPIGEVEALPFDTTKATVDSFGTPDGCVRSPNIWYRYTASCTGQATISLCGSSFDTVVAVYKGSECYPQQKDMIGCNDDACGRQSELTIDVVAGDQYLIEVGGFGPETGQGVLSISCEGEAPEPFELGDAPDSSNSFGSIRMTAYPKGGPPGRRAYYPTVYAAGSPPYGPIHSNPLAVAHLGEKATHENEADIGPDADGVNNIDPPANSPDRDGADDGVIFPLNLPLCCWTTFDYLVKVVNPDTDLWVNVWFDWNRDGDWDDILDCSDRPVPEWAVQNQYLFNLPAGLHQITTRAFRSWHPDDWTTHIWMRITLSEQPWKGGENPDMRGNGGSGPQAGYEIGETEDYYFRPDTTSYSVCNDLNGDGSVGIDDLTTYVADWLEGCP